MLPASPFRIENAPLHVRPLRSSAPSLSAGIPSFSIRIARSGSNRSAYRCAKSGQAPPDRRESPDAARAACRSCRSTVRFATGDTTVGFRPRCGFVPSPLLQSGHEPEDGYPTENPYVHRQDSQNEPNSGTAIPPPGPSLILAPAAPQRPAGRFHIAPPSSAAGRHRQ